MGTGTHLGDRHLCYELRFQQQKSLPKFTQLSRDRVSGRALVAFTLAARRQGPEP